jgi:hypothetical protein
MRAPSMEVSVRLGNVRDRSVALLFLTYALGPLAPALSRRGWVDGLWALLGLVGFPIWAGMAWRWQEVSVWLQSGRLPFFPWLAGVCGLAFLGFAAWSRAVFLAGWDARFFPERLPRGLREPWIAGLLGLVAPGSGLLVSGAPRRAALALCNSGVVLLAGLGLWKVRWLWACNRSGSGTIDSQAMEYLLLGALGIGSLGALVWIASALDGARRARLRASREAEVRGDWSAFALLVALAAFFATLRPPALARELDALAQRLRPAGFAIAPLQATRLAMKLDPARPSYALHAAQLCETLGRHGEAERLRNELRARWKEYTALLHKDASDPEVLLPLPPPIEPGMPATGSAGPGVSGSGASRSPRSGAAAAPTIGADVSPSGAAQASAAGASPGLGVATSPATGAASAGETTTGAPPEATAKAPAAASVSRASAPGGSAPAGSVGGAAASSAAAPGAMKPADAKPGASTGGAASEDTTSPDSQAVRGRAPREAVAPEEGAAAEPKTPAAPGYEPSAGSKEERPNSVEAASGNSAASPAASAGLSGSPGGSSSGASSGSSTAAGDSSSAGGSSSRTSEQSSPAPSAADSTKAAAPSPTKPAAGAVEPGSKTKTTKPASPKRPAKQAVLSARDRVKRT